MSFWEEDREHRATQKAGNMKTQGEAAVEISPSLPPLGLGYLSSNPETG